MAEEPKGPQDPTPGNPGGNPSGNPDPNVVALQQKLSQKDVELKKVQEELEKAKAGPKDGEGNKEVAALTETVKKLTDQISTLSREGEIKKLTEKYPDILPEFLVGKTEAEIESLVKKQKDLDEARRGRMPSTHVPKYKDVAEVDKAIEDLKADRTLTTEEKLVKLRELKNLKQEF